MLLLLLLACGFLAVIGLAADGRPRTVRPYEKNGWRHRSDLDAPSFHD